MSSTRAPARAAMAAPRSAIGTLRRSANTTGAARLRSDVGRVLAQRLVQAGHQVGVRQPLHQRPAQVGRQVTVAAAAQEPAALGARQGLGDLVDRRGRDVVDGGGDVVLCLHDPRGDRAFGAAHAGCGQEQRRAVAARLARQAPRVLVAGVDQAPDDARDGGAGHAGQRRRLGRRVRGRSPGKPSTHSPRLRSMGGGRSGPGGLCR
ncbi:hypothetical protein [Pseudorhodoferax sp.]|uniref:hypothetical protein n=1 Tax=Pseudorhodoferax sp. TaxID=1993553 RepID=UPI0039E4C492